MHNRCYNKNDKMYHRYGGRGIKVCKRWRKFENFAKDMGEKPKGMSIDRVDNNGNYDPKNCVWATPAQQNRNRCNVRRYNVNGEILTIREASEKYNIEFYRLRGRIYLGWSIEQALGLKPRRPSPEDIIIDDCKDRREIIHRMASRGCTYKSIGNYLGLTKQRIHQIVYPHPVDNSLD